MLEVAEKLMMIPFETSTSPPSKSVVGTLAVNVTVRDPSAVVEPLETGVPS